MQEVAQRRERLPRAGWGDNIFFVVSLAAMP